MKEEDLEHREQKEDPQEPAKAEPELRRRVRLSYGKPSQDGNAPWIWIAVIFLVAVAMVASRGCSSSMENLARVFMEDAPPASGQDASVQHP